MAAVSSTYKLLLLKFTGYVTILICLSFLSVKATAQKHSRNLFYNDTIIVKSSDSTLLIQKIRRVMSEKRDLGYINIATDSIHSRATGFVAGLYPGKKYRWKHFSVKQPDQYKINLPAPSFKKGSIVNYSEYKAYNTKLISNLANRGFPFGSIVPDINIYGNKLSVKLNIRPGKRYQFDSIAFNRDIITNTYLQNYLNIKYKHNYDESKVKKIDQKMAQLPFLSLTKDPVVTFGDQLARPEINLAKKQANVFDGLLGLTPDDENEGKYLVTGDLNLKLVNTLKRGESLELKWKKNNRYSQELESSLKWPYIIKSPLGIKGDIQMLKEDTSFVYLDLKGGVFIQFNGANTVTGYYQKKQTIVLTPEDTVGIAATNSYGSGLALTFQQLNAPLNPYKGYQIEADISLGRRTFTEIENKNADKQTNYYSNLLNVAGYVPIYKNWILKIANQFEGIYTENLLFKNELLRTGGLKTMRGFNENAFFADYYNISTLEIRWLFEHLSHFKTFTDIGYIHTHHTTNKNSGWVYAIGIGANLATRAGIFSINYTLGRYSNTSFRLNNAKIHFGYINNF